MTGIIIQARLGSTRLPQKMIIPFYKNKGILEILISRIMEHDLNLPIILATTDNPKDNTLEKIAMDFGINIFRGSEKNVLERFIKAAEQYEIDKIIRVCADNPFLDILALEYLMQSFMNIDVDYWCYALSNNTPTIKTHYGFWAEGVKLSALKKIKNNTTNSLFLEHVTNYIYSNPEYFTIHFEQIKQTIEAQRNIRLTIDTQVDFQLGQNIFENLISNRIPLTSVDITNYLKRQDDILRIMSSEITKNIK
jgi:spore coat polysaccharide biosynthesis protein SpsF